MINVKIDDVVVAVDRPFEWTVDGAEEYDQGTIVITNSSQKKAYPDYAIVEIDTKRFILAKDYVKRLGQGNYEHSIDLKEEVYLLKGIVTWDRKFSTWNGVRVTYEYIVEQFIQSYDLDDLFGLTIDTETQTLLDTPADFTEFVGGTLLDHLVKIFRAVRAVPTLTDGVIGHNLLGDVGVAISVKLQGQIDDDEVEQYQERSQIENYASKVITKAKNAVYERDEDVTSIFPYEGGFTTPRSTSNRYTDDTAQIVCDSNIRNVYNLYHKITFDYTPSSQGFFGSVGDLPTNPNNGDYYECDTDGYYSAVADETFDTLDNAVWVYDEWLKNSIAAPTEIEKIIDFNQFLFPFNDWDKKEIETNYNTMKTGFYTNNTLYFKDNLVLNLGEEYNNSLVLSRSAYEMMIASFESNALYGTSGLSIISVDLVDTEWQFKYHAKRDVAYIQGRAPSNLVTKDISIINQQSDSEVELSRLGRASASKVNRIGNDKYQVTVIVDSLDDVENIFNYDSNGYTITSYKVEARYDDYTVMYDFAKNNAPLKINEATSNPISRYTITDRQVNTNVIKHYHVIISETNLTDDSQLPTAMKSRILNIFDYEEAYDKPIRTAVYESVSSTPTYIGMSVQPSVVDNVMVFQAQFQSPTVAGTQLITYTVLGVTGHNVKNVNYTDSYGQVSDYKIQWCNQVGAPTVNSWPVLNSYSPIFGNVTHTVKLNPDEILQVTAEIDIQSMHDNMFVYSNLAQNNSLVKELGAGKTFTIYYYNNKINAYNVNSTELDITYDSIGSLSINKATGEFNITVPSGSSWVIADEDKNIYIARNYRGTDISKFYVNLMKYNQNY